MSCKQLDCQAAFFPDVPPLPPFPFLSPPLSLLHSFLGALSTFGSLSKTKIKERERERECVLCLSCWDWVSSGVRSDLSASEVWDRHRRGTSARGW